MSISFACSQCGKRYSVTDQMAGKRAKCGCGSQLLVPLSSSEIAMTTSESSLFDDLTSFEKTATTMRPAGSSISSSSLPPVTRPSLKRTASSDRGANIRRNLRRWWKPLLALNVGWFVLTLVVGIGAISYAHAHHFGEKRVQMLGQGCGTAMAISLGVLWLTVLLVADRRKSQ
ncbi:MAG: hypothetical protein ACYC6N_24510 [Pirellulaceae bacterium]